MLLLFIAFHTMVQATSDFPYKHLLFLKYKREHFENMDKPYIVIIVYLLPSSFICQHINGCFLFCCTKRKILYKYDTGRWVFLYDVLEH